MTKIKVPLEVAWNCTDMGVIRSHNEVRVQVAMLGNKWV